MNLAGHEGTGMNLISESRQKAFICVRNRSVWEGEEQWLTAKFPKLQYIMHTTYHYTHTSYILYAHIIIYIHIK